MNIVNECPNIPDNWKGGVSDVSRILGICRKTIDKYCKLGRRRGGIDYKIGKSGRKVFLGKEVKRFWREF